MTTGLIYDDRFCNHNTGPGHPERPERLRAIVAHLKRTGHWDRLTHLPFEPAATGWVRAVHDGAYIDRVAAASRQNAHFIDVPDSAVSPESYSIALLAVGGALEAVNAVMKHQVDNAICLLRPPGHHAEFDRSMGFCLFNNIAIAAECLIQSHELQRVAIVDFDVHHGNGTQHTFDMRQDVFFISIHQDPRTLYPGTGYAEERGIGDGAGFTLNIPLPPHSGDEDYLHVFEQRVIPALHNYDPQVLLVSAGFDAAAADPLAQMQVTDAGFRYMLTQLHQLASEHCLGRLIACLEGGYNLDALASGVEQMVDVWLDSYNPADADVR